MDELRFFETLDEEGRKKFVEMMRPMMGFTMYHAMYEGLLTPEGELNPVATFDKYQKNGCDYETVLDFDCIKKLNVKPSKDWDIYWLLAEANHMMLSDATRSRINDILQRAFNLWCKRHEDSN